MKVLDAHIVKYGGLIRNTSHCFVIKFHADGRWAGRQKAFVTDL